MKSPFESLVSPAQRALQNNGIQSIEALAEYSEKDILKFHGIGKSSIPTLKKLLEQHNLTFKNS